MDEVRFHPESQAEYQAALAWYQARSPQAALRFETELERVLDAVVANPNLFPAYDDRHRFSMLRRYSYSLVYRTLPGQILVVAVAHNHRKAGYWKGRA